MHLSLTAGAILNFGPTCTLKLNNHTSGMCGTLNTNTAWITIISGPKFNRVRTVKTIFTWLFHLDVTSFLNWFNWNKSVYWYFWLWKRNSKMNWRIFFNFAKATTTLLYWRFIEKSSKHHLGVNQTIRFEIQSKLKMLSNMRIE